MVMLTYPAARYLWLVERLAEVAAAFDVLSNADAVVKLIEHWAEETAPDADAVHEPPTAYDRALTLARRDGPLTRAALEKAMGGNHEVNFTAIDLAILNGALIDGANGLTVG